MRIIEPTWSMRISVLVIVSGLLGVVPSFGETLPMPETNRGWGLVVQNSPSSNSSSKRQVAPPKVQTIPFIRLLGGDPTKASITVKNLKGPTEPSILFGNELSANFTIPRHTADSTSGQKIYVHVTGLSDPPKFGSEGGEFRLHFAFPSLQLKGYYKNYSPDGDNEIADVQIQNAAVDIFLQPSVGPEWRPTFAQARVQFSGQLTEPKQCLTLVDVLYPVNVCSIMKEYYDQIKTLVENGLREALQGREIRFKFDQGAWAQVEREVGNMDNARIVSAVFRGTDFLIQYYP